MDKQLLKFDLQAQAYVKASFFTILVYDWVFTFSNEISYIWHSRWGIIKFLFIYTRYSTFVDTIMTFREQVIGVPVLAPVCGTTFETGAANLPPSLLSLQINGLSLVFSGAGMGMCGLILMVWTYTLYERSRKVLCLFALFWMIMTGIGAWAVIKWANTFSMSSSQPGFNGNLGCTESRTSSLRYLGYSSLLGGETVVLILTVIKAIQMAGIRSLSRLMRLFNECGVIFYLGIFAFTLTDVVLLFISPDGLWELDFPVRVMHTVLTCRLVLHLRGVAIKKMRGEKEVQSDVGSQIRSLGDLSCEDWEEEEEDRRLMAAQSVHPSRESLC
ncbi:hypothetical protein L218DRAFT_989667 [Marasmius fiardii PR-910]|nr:hypothetical protein L218DRAFT_989667 [Marasmius fiardii PR-910]